MIYQDHSCAQHLLDKDSTRDKTDTVHLSLNCIDCLYLTFSSSVRVWFNMISADVLISCEIKYFE